MFRYLVITLSVILSTTAYAQSESKQDLICAIKSATYYKKILESQSLEVDKFRHCSVSCIVGIECGVGPSAVIGVAKEIYDLFGGGTPELADLLANIRGIKLGQQSDIQNFEECKTACLKIYE